MKNSGDLRQMSAESARLERLIFTAEEFAALKFVRPGREFVYLGNQYDVHSISRVTCSAAVARAGACWCWSSAARWPTSAACI
jgi:hypothetical protein